MGGSVNSFDYFHTDKMSVIELCNMEKELGLGKASLENNSE